MQRLFHSRIFWFGSILFGLLYVVWADNIQGMRFGNGTIGASRFVHWPFIFTPFLAFAAGFSFLMVGVWYMSLKAGIADIAAIGVEGALWVWLLGATVVFTYAALVGSPVFSEQRNIRVSTSGTTTYLLQGTGGGSGNMFYRLFMCDHLELRCKDVIEQPIVLGVGDNPTVQVDSEQQIVTISDNGQDIQIVPIPVEWEKKNG